MLALGHETFQADGATFIRSHELPDIWEANHVCAITAATGPEIERLLARVEREYAGFGHRRFDCDFTTPPEFEARLTLAGYEARAFVVLVLDGELAVRAASVDIRPCEDEPAWAALTALSGLNWREHRLRGADDTVGERLARAHRRHSPPATYWLAWVDGEPRGYLASWSGLDGVGQVEDLYVHGSVRRRGVAAALIRHGVATCRAAGAGPVVIVADATDTPKAAYARMGFRPVAVLREYLLHPRPPDPR